MDLRQALEAAIAKGEKAGKITPQRAARARKNLAAKAAKELNAVGRRAAPMMGATTAAAIDWSKLIDLMVKLLPLILALFGL